MKKLSQALVSLLMLDAAWVFIGLVQGKNMFLFICGYWAILTAKNAVDWIAGRKK